MSGILDWSARIVVIGDRHADLGVADSLRLFRPKMPWGVRWLGRRGTSWMSASLVGAYAAHGNFDATRLRFYRLFHCIRLTSWISERRLGLPGLIRPDASLGAWTGPERLTGYLAHVQEETGIRIRAPVSQGTDPALPRPDARDN